MNNGKITSCGWEWETRPIPKDFDDLYYRLKQPYFKEEKEYFENYGKQLIQKYGEKYKETEEYSDYLKKCIIVFYQPGTGIAEYTVPLPFGAPSFDDLQKFKNAPGRLHKLNTRGFRKNGYRHYFVDFDFCDDGTIVFRFFVLYMKVLLNREKPEDVLESFRLYVSGGDVWIENRKSGFSNGSAYQVIRSLLSNETSDSVPEWYDSKKKREHPLFRANDNPLAVLACISRLISTKRRFKGIPEEILRSLDTPFDQLPRQHCYFTEYYSYPFNGIYNNTVWVENVGSEQYLCVASVRSGQIRTALAIKFKGCKIECIQFNPVISEERYYIGEKKVFAFIRNAEQKLVSMPSNYRSILGCKDIRHVCQQGDERSLAPMIGLSDFLKDQDLKGFAWYAASPLLVEPFSQHVGFRIELDMLRQAQYHLSVEQALKMAVSNSSTNASFGSNALSALSYLPASAKGKKNLPETLGVRGSDLKHLAAGFPNSHSLVWIAENKRKIEMFFKRSKRNGYPVDRCLFFEASDYLPTRFDTFVEYASHKHDPNSWLRLLNRNTSRGLGLLQMYRDYQRMRSLANTVAREQYPEDIVIKDIIYMHRHVLRDYMRAETMEQYSPGSEKYEKFRCAVSKKSYQNLLFEDEKMTLLAPKEPADLLIEGIELSHCVGSYIDPVSRDLSKIYFLRYKKTPDNAYCTIEVRNDAVTQCYNAHDSVDNNPDKIAFIQKWTKAKKLRIRCRIGSSDDEYLREPARHDQEGLVFI